MIWSLYRPSSAQPWDLRRVKHLHRRAALGATWSELQEDIADGAEQSISRLLAGNARREAIRDNFEEMSEIIGNAAAGSSSANLLRAWWIYRLLFTPHPLQEKLTLLWHSHFATSNLKVDDLLLMRQQNELFREHALGRFGDLLHGVIRDPAMLYWLDANSNRAGHPNENLARELMELFTLGAGNYTEDDVKAAARALTGWTAKREQVTFRADRHDSSKKMVLGRTGDLDADGLADLLLDHTATSHRLAWRLCDSFMGEGVADMSAIEELASGLRNHGLSIRWAVETILRSELFFSDANIGSRVSSPIEFVVGTVRSLELLEKPPSTLILAEWCTRLGQNLFYPPNVAGWSGGRNWLTSRTIVGRANFAAALVSGQLRLPVDAAPLGELAAKHKAHGTHESAIDFFGDLLLSDPKHIKLATDKSLEHQVAHLLSRPESQLT